MLLLFILVLRPSWTIFILSLFHIIFVCTRTNLDKLIFCGALNELALNWMVYALSVAWYSFPLQFHCASWSNWQTNKLLLLNQFSYIMLLYPVQVWLSCHQFELQVLQGNLRVAFQLIPVSWCCHHTVRQGIDQCSARILLEWNWRHEAQDSLSVSLKLNKAGIICFNAIDK